MQVCRFRRKMDESSDYQGISWLNEVSSGSVDMNLKPSISTIEDVGFKASATCDVPNVNRLVWEESGAVEEIAGNGDTTFVVDVCLGNDGSVNLSKK